MNLDDRLSAAPVLGDIVPYTAQGLPVAIAPTSVSYNSSAGPGPIAVTLQYSPSGITNVTALQFNQGAFTGPVISSVRRHDQQSVPQIDDPPNSAAILQGLQGHEGQAKRSTRSTTGTTGTTGSPATAPVALTATGATST